MIMKAFRVDTTRAFLISESQNSLTCPFEWLLPIAAPCRSKQGLAVEERSLCSIRRSARSSSLRQHPRSRIEEELFTSPEIFLLSLSV